ncbi:MAG: hypothetical protein IJ695_10700 [Butyrivibrio sp.]|nr:hypothetical protein [Butyrivibrio sp.]
MGLNKTDLQNIEDKNKNKVNEVLQTGEKKKEAEANKNTLLFHDSKLYTSSGRKRTPEEIKRLELRKRAEKIKPLTKDQIKRNAHINLNYYHGELERAELLTFGKEGIENLDKQRYKNLSDDDKEKRAKEAIKRYDYAKKLEDFEIIDKETPVGALSEKEFADAMAKFKKISYKDIKIDGDKEFVKNIENNLKICRNGKIFEKHLKDAIEGGYAPKGDNLSDLFTKVETLKKVEEYIGKRKRMMKSPYYQYLASKDVNYTDNQLERLIEKTTDKKLKEYLEAYRDMRSVRHIHKDGIKALGKSLESEGERIATYEGDKQEMTTSHSVVKPMRREGSGREERAG